MRLPALLAFFMMLSASIAAPASADNRVALVIGNGAYQNSSRLPNPANDAADIGAALKRSGFEVIVGTDLSKTAMDEAIIRFSRAARAADVAVFYYSGHAIQFGGVNYLMPVDAKLADEADLRRMVRVDDIVAEVQQARILRILVLDSCRDNPLADQLKRSIGTTRAVSLQRGLARIDSPQGMIIAYSTQAGNTADDGAGRNSPYTAAFLKNVETKEEIGTVFRRTSADVYEKTAKKQLPELSLSLIGEFYLNGKLQITVTIPQGTADPCAVAADHWKSAEAIGTAAAFEDHVTRFPGCAFAGLAKVRIEGLKEKLAAVVASPSPPAAGPPAAPAGPRVASLGPIQATVEAKEGWQPTEINIVSPGTIEFRTAGKWSFNPRAPLVDANGHAQLSTRGRPEYAFNGDGGREGQLIGRIGYGEPFIVGVQSSHTIGKGETGTLYLVINDDLYSRVGQGLNDNSGKLVVNVRAR
jgi:hypothetical protein